MGRRAVKVTNSIGLAVETIHTDSVERIQNLNQGNGEKETAVYFKSGSCITVKEDPEILEKIIFHRIDKTDGTSERGNNAGLS